MPIFFRASAVLLLAAATIAPAASMAQVQAPSTLPNGASSLSEAYQDWQVVCAAGKASRTCAITQQQRKRDTNQLVLAAEFNQVSGDTVAGRLILPFGLKLQDGVSYQVGDGPLSKPLAFSTCMPAGCLVPLTLDGATTKAIRSGKSLKIAAKPQDGGQPLTLEISPKGFGTALDRLAGLNKP